MRTTRALAVFVALALAAGWARAETPIPPAPERWVTDHAGFLSAPTAAALDQRLEAYERGTGHQVLVYIDHTTGGVPVEDWANRAFEAWRVGRKGIDDGAVLFVFSDDRKARIEVGYGLEDRLPDALAGRIINDDMIPRIKAGDNDGAVLAGVRGVMSAVGGTGEAGEGAPAARAPAWAGIVGLLVFVVLIWGALRHPALAALLLLNIGGGRRGGGGGWGGGGGFSGGGGRSGGGGASGSW
jgi:uncharacterized protein